MAGPEPIGVVIGLASDDEGRAATLTPEERRRRADALREALSDLATMSGSTDRTVDWDAAEREMDRERPWRPLFSGRS
jgi:hypothetical protein